MIRIRLGDADRDRLGAPEALDVDLTRMTLEEGEIIEAATGLTPLGLYAGAVRMSARAWHAIVWLGLRRLGKDTPITDVRLDNYLAIRFDDSDADADPKGSPKSSGSPTRRSATTVPRSSRSSGAGRATRTGG